MAWLHSVYSIHNSRNKERGIFEIDEGCRSAEEVLLVRELFCAKNPGFKSGVREPVRCTSKRLKKVNKRRTTCLR